MPTKTTEERKLTLSSGHPQAGYVSPDLSLQDGTGTLPDNEQDWHDARDEARQAEAEAVAENEDKTAKAEAKAAEEAAAKTTAPAPTPKASTSSS